MSDAATADFLRKNGLDAFINTFANEEVTFDLLPALTDEQLKDL
jgi:hypothetical protein